LNKASLTYEDVKEQIRGHWRWSIRDSEETDAEAEREKALTAAGGASKYKNQRGGEDMGEGEFKCHGCGGVGHKIAVCPSKISRQQRGAGGGSGRGAGGNRGRGYGHHYQQRIKGKKIHGNCFKCGEFGHPAWDCKEDEGTEQKRDSGNEGKKNQQPAANTAAYWQEDEEEIALSAVGLEEHSMVVAAAVENQDKQQQSSSWIVDSGCSMHMVKSEEGLTEIKWQKRRVVVAGGRILEAIGVGRIKGSVTTHEGKNIDISFHDVLVVPSLDRNLLSVTRIVDRGGEVTFGSNGAFISIKGMRLPLKACSGIGLYELEFRNPQACKKRGSAAAQQEAQEDQVQHVTMTAIGKIEVEPAAATAIVESRVDYKKALLSGLGKPDKSGQQPSIQHEYLRSSSTGSRKKFEECDGERSQSSRSRKQWHGRVKPRERPMAVKPRKGAWHRSQSSSRDNRWWAMGKPIMRSKRGALASVGDRRGELSEQRKKLGIIAEKQKWTSTRQSSSQQEKDSSEGWNLVQRYKGKRLKWSRAASVEEKVWRVKAE